MAGVQAAATGSSASNRGVSVKKLTEQLEGAKKQINTLKGAKAKIAENAGRAGSAVVTAAEVGASAALGGAATGLAGEKHRGAVRIVRGVTATSLLTWGLFDILRGKNGSHQMAVGEGLMAAELAETGARLGQMARNKWAAVPSTPVVNGVAGAPVAAPQVVVTPAIAGPREVLPFEADLEGFRQRGRARAARGS